MNQRTVTIDYLGCKLNQAEVEALSIDFAGAGYRQVPLDEEPRVCVLNSCTVTHVADRKTRQWLRRARRQNPSALIIVTGCFTERAPLELKQIDEKVLVLDNRQKMGMVRWLLEHNYLESCSSEDCISGGLSKTRSFVRIQEGCSNGCAYCIVPLVRNECSSRSPGDVIGEIQNRISAGHKEIIITGTEIGSYNSGGSRLCGLVKMILDRTQVERLRLSSLQPYHITGEMLDLWSDGRLCPHFHLSLQSGSDAVLKRMKRHYNREYYTQTIQKIRESVPDVAITTDVIVGFPGETQADFEETLDVCRKTGFARIHVFPYSQRPDTQALEMRPLVDEKEKKRREKEMIGLAEETGRVFRQRFAGRIMPVLWESCSGELWTGLTPNYTRVYMPGKDCLADTITSVRILDLYRDGVKGEPG
ncbi:MAG: tRNA (N(6)-L-threonylcarbamoyladenosine(37)-C(2))-methylthiotransferase MtaB [Dehalococcoidales bacterium]|nr:tRNA (N(6)-L-threonylcarbamoyladenosine(37)-C(2))-methylthiotransferase MtaB [Dehalococcoidales bacterium]